MQIIQSAFDVEDIMKYTPQEWVGKPITDFASVWIDTITVYGNGYQIMAVFDLATDLKMLVVTHKDVIVNKLIGG